VSWTFVLLLSGGAYLLKAVGFVVLPRLEATDRAAPLISLLPAALLVALVVVGTFEAEGSVVLDARVLGVLAAGVAVLLRAPFVVVIVVAPLVTALARALG
jgi:branched-subunit amino acid transport protein